MFFSLSTFPDRCTSDNTSSGEQPAALAHSGRERRLLWVHHPSLAVRQRDKMAFRRPWTADKHFSWCHRQQSVAGAAESEAQPARTVHLLGHQWRGRGGEQRYSLEGSICTRLQNRYVLLYFLRIFFIFISRQNKTSCLLNSQLLNFWPSHCLFHCVEDASNSQVTFWEKSSFKRQSIWKQNHISWQYNVCS